MGLQGKKLIGNGHFVQMPVIDRAAQGRQSILLGLFRSWGLDWLASIIEKIKELPEQAETGCCQQKKKKTAEPMFSAPLSGGRLVRRSRRATVFVLPAPHQ
jgi:hypothetical protein